jgi:hypothetical protein
MWAMIEPLDSFDSDRRFQMWRYSVSHGQLLLRSNRDNDHATRIEVLFKAVDRVELPTLMHGLRVRRDSQRFMVGGQEWQGSVDALVMFAMEDAEDFAAPSQLFIGGL